MNIVSEVIHQYLGGRAKATPNGWHKFDAPCCVHNGESRDTRQRGGLIDSGEVVSYHCFNCNFTTSWQPGRALSYKMRKLLEWMGVPDDAINKLALEVLKHNQGIEAQLRPFGLPQFEDRELPEDARLITDDPCDENKYLTKVKQYMASRKLWTDQGYDYYWSPQLAYRDRFIVPFLYQGRTVGWTSRTTNPKSKSKYLMDKQPGFVFNLDQQTPRKVFCVVVEGALDAIQIDGVAVLTNEINDSQALLLNQLNRDVIVVPDRDEPGRALIERSIELGYQVSMPEWDSSIKDASDAVLRYGRLYTLYSIANAAESSPLKIRLREKKWYKK